MSTRALHEKFHQNTRYQKKIINKKNFTYRILASIIKNSLNKSRARTLDIGCGAGTLSLYLASKGHEVLGIDISSKAIKECERSKDELGFENIKFKQFNFPDNFPKEKFDIVIFTEVIEHLKDGKKALSTINSLLNPNGIMILSTPSNKAPLHRIGLTKEFDIKVGHVKRYSLNEITGMIVDAGFVVRKIYLTEGILRNFLFVNPIAGKLVRYLNHFDFLSDIVTNLDNLSLRIFGESNIVIVAKKG